MLICYQWTGLNDQSDMIEDSPPEMVKEYERRRAEEKAKKAQEDKEKEDKEGGDKE